MTTATKHFESIAHLCASLQAPHARVVRAVQSLGIEPAETRNGVAFYDGDQCERIADAIRQHTITNALQGGKR
jgi:hypothetical protein